MAHDHSGGKTGASAQPSPDARKANEKRLLLAIGLTGTYLVAEVIGGIAFNSLALLSDAAHMLTDVMALIIAYVAIQIGKKAADAKRTYGYRRFEVVAAVFNAIVLFLVAIYILYEAWQRFSEPPEVQTTGMLIVAVIGLVVNLVSMKVLQGGSDESLNMKGAYLEVLADMLGSAGVIVAAILIYITKIPQVDPILAVLIGLWVLPRTWNLLSESMHVLLEGVPAGIDMHKVQSDLESIRGVQGVHDLHVWSVTTGQNSLTAHLVVATIDLNERIVTEAQAVAGKHGVAHATFQIETAAFQDREKQRSSSSI
ncbi:MULTISPECIES: cation diffusion facilitator family transporter [Asticcacaulis]|uniref:cation diffusion facilitator family transporter n=1 Tax=Asticcacaulis TaxID=76890 RepID=UPI001AEA1585|nr:MULTISPECIES: cation diffusion facilitator family transporter [Asticcacaulis]MBP2160470.1 cobalt-zinc-cadmium efflux system protein [Asticcacaulis solisilvae]MDR6801515.1 cobalt-zinc-cadmium efflux system protein [Asticcacaulis sp. BE141]